MSYLESLRVFVRVVELGSITAGGRDLRLTPSTASGRIKELEARFGVRLLNRTTRKLTTTEIGQVLFDDARKVISALEETESNVASYRGTPQGVLRMIAPVVLGRRLIAPLIPEFRAANPEIELRLHLTDRNFNLVEDHIDIGFVLGQPADSTLSWRKFADCARVLVAAPDYLARAGTPQSPDDLMAHNCLLLRFPRSPEYFWVLDTAKGPRRMTVSGGFDTDDGDVLTGWALARAGIANRPRYEVADDLETGRLIEVLPDSPPIPAQCGCLTPHRRLRDPKVRLFVDFAAARLKSAF